MQIRVHVWRSSKSIPATRVGEERLRITSASRLLATGGHIVSLAPAKLRSEAAAGGHDPPSHSATDETEPCLDR